MPVTFPDFDEGKGISLRPGNSFSDRLGCIIGTSDELISSFWIGLTGEARGECLTRDRIDTTTRESLHSRLLIEMEPEDIEGSPD